MVLSLGRWFGVPVYLHASCLAFALTIIYIACRAFPDQEMVGYGLLAIVMWLLSLLIHQAGHLAAAAHIGGICERVVISPLGDLTPVSVPQDPRGELKAAIMGPVFNAIVLLIVTPALLISGSDVRDLLFSPLVPQNLVVGGVGLVALKMAFWCNWLLILANLLPALPMDTGRAVCAGLRPTMGERDAIVMVAHVGALVCIPALWIWGALDAKTGMLIPPWFPLSLLTVYLFLMARRAPAHGRRRARRRSAGLRFFAGLHEPGTPGRNRPPRAGPAAPLAETAPRAKATADSPNRRGRRTPRR